MFKMTRFSPMLLALLLLVFAVAALSATINASWTNATENTDGSAIPATGPGSLTNTVMEYGPCNAGRNGIVGTAVVVVTPAPGTNPEVAPNVGPGTWCAHVRHTNTYGEVSAWSGWGVKVVENPVPNPPSNFSWL